MARKKPPAQTTAKAAAAPPAPAPAPAAAGRLPTLVVSPADVNRLIRELKAIDDTLREHQLRKAGKAAGMLKASQLMAQTAELNNLNLLHETDRQRLAAFLEGVRQHSPVLHISFSADPSAAFLQKIMSWLRQEIHPQLLLTIGLQPTIGAGCIIRSTNRYFDCSLRQDFSSKRALLLEQLAVKPAARKAAT